MVFFGKNKSKARSFEEITSIRGESEEASAEEVVEDESSSEKTSVATEKEEKVEKIVKTAIPFNTGDFNALSCFGWKEDKTEAWLKKCAKVWFLMASFVWFIFGAITFAPIIFISNKVDVLFNDRKKSLMCGIIIYAVCVVLIALLFATRGGGDASQVVNAEKMTEAITSETTEIMQTR